MFSGIVNLIQRHMSEREAQGMHAILKEFPQDAKLLNLISGIKTISSRSVLPETEQIAFIGTYGLKQPNFWDKSSDEHWTFAGDHAINLGNYAVAEFCYAQGRQEEKAKKAGRLFKAKFKLPTLNPDIVLAARAAYDDGRLKSVAKLYKKEDDSRVVAAARTIESVANIRPSLDHYLSTAREILLK